MQIQLLTAAHFDLEFSHFEDVEDKDNPSAEVKYRLHFFTPGISLSQNSVVPIEGFRALNVSNFRAKVDKSFMAAHKDLLIRGKRLYAYAGFDSLGNEQSTLIWFRIFSLKAAA